MIIMTYFTYLFISMNKESIRDLIISIRIIPKKNKLVLINSVEKKRISEKKLREILEEFKKIQNEMGKNTENIGKESKTNYIRILKKAINNSIIRLQQINLEIDELIFKKQEWNPDDILNLDKDIW